MTDSLSQSLKSHYTKTVAEPERPEQLRKAFLHRLSMEEGARLAGYKTGQRSCHPDNPRIQEEAAKLRQTEEFKETTAYLLQKNSLEELEDYESNVISGINLYQDTSLKLRYEKIVSEIGANMVHGAELNQMQPEERKQQLSKYAAALRKTPAFQKLIQEKIKDFYTPIVTERNIKKLEKTEERMKIGKEVFDALNKGLQKQDAHEELLQGEPVKEQQAGGLENQSIEKKGPLV